MFKLVVNKIQIKIFQRIQFPQLNNKINNIRNNPTQKTLITVKIYFKCKNKKIYWFN